MGSEGCIRIEEEDEELSEGIIIIKEEQEEEAEAVNEGLIPINEEGIVLIKQEEEISHDDDDDAMDIDEKDEIRSDVTEYRELSFGYAPDERVKDIGNLEGRTNKQR